MAGLIYDEQSLVDSQIYKYDKYLHSRINKYTGDARTPVTYFNINENQTTTSLGMDTHYQIIGKDSPLRFNKISNFFLLNFSPLSPQENDVEGTQVRNYNLEGEAFIIPGTIMPRENDFFIVKEVNMNHLFRVTLVTQDGLNTDGSYKISYKLYTTNDNEINDLYRQVVDDYVMDLQTIGGTDLTPIIGENDYELRRRLISMIDDMTDNYIAQFYDPRHNCFLLHLNGQTLFDVCGHMFMAKNAVMIRDNATKNVVLADNKIRASGLPLLYEKSPYKWIERDAPIRYLQQFKYKTVSGYDFPDSSFANYGTDVDVMIPGDAWCAAPDCEQYFPFEVVDIFESKADIRTCHECDCNCCCKRHDCIKGYKMKRYDYISIIHDFIHGQLTDIHKLSLYTGDQLFDLSMSKEVYLWTPIIIYILKQVLKIK